MLQGEHSAILSTFTKLPFVIKIFVLSVFKWPLKTGFRARPVFLFFYVQYSPFIMLCLRSIEMDHVIIESYV